MRLRSGARFGPGREERSRFGHYGHDNERSALFKRCEGTGGKTRWGRGARGWPVALFAAK
jgi:hypothetical protein